MIRSTIISLFISMAVALFPLASVLAHGEPVISVEPSIIAAGGQITVTGTEMEPGETFSITLENAMVSIPLGEVTSSGEGEDGGFQVEFTIPADTEPGSYSVVATAEDGDATSADLEITAPSEEASSAPAEMDEASGEQHILERSRSPVEVIGALIALLISAGIGVALVRTRE